MFEEKILENRKPDTQSKIEKNPRNSLKEVETEVGEVELIKVNLPFVKVSPINYMGYVAEERLVLVARSNSVIEIWSYPYWQVLTRIQLDLRIIIKQLFYIKNKNGPQLAIITANAYIFLYSLTTGKKLQHVHHGGDFCWNASHFYYKEENQILQEKNQENFSLIALACNDGALRLYTSPPEGGLISKGSAAAQAAAALDVSFSNCGNYIFSCYEDCSIRKFSSKLKTLFAAELQRADKEEKAWAVRQVPDNFVVVGFSSGRVVFLEASFGTVIKEFDRVFEGDILELLVTKDTKRIFATGSDSKICLFTKLTTEVGGLERTDFELTSTERGQSHDIYSLVELHEDLIASAGLSTDICLYKIKNGKFQERRQGTDREIKLRHIVADFDPEQIQISAQSGLIALNSFNSLEIFSIEINTKFVNFLSRIETEEDPILSSALHPKLPIVAYSQASKLEILWFQIEKEEVRRINTEFNNEGAAKIIFKGNYLYGLSLKTQNIFWVHIGTKKSSFIKIPSLTKIARPDYFGVRRADSTAVVADRYNSIVLVIDLSSGGARNLPSYQQRRLMGVELSSIKRELLLCYETNRFVVVNNNGKIKYASFSKLGGEIGQVHDKFRAGLFHQKLGGRILLYSKYSIGFLNRDRAYKKIERRKEREMYTKIEFEKKEDEIFKIFRTELPILGVGKFEDGRLMVVGFEWERAMREIPAPIVARKFEK